MKKLLSWLRNPPVSCTRCSALVWPEKYPEHLAHHDREITSCPTCHLVVTRARFDAHLDWHDERTRQIQDAKYPGPIGALRENELGRPVWGGSPHQGQGQGRISGTIGRPGFDAARTQEGL